MEGTGKPAKKDAFGFFEPPKAGEYDASGKQIVCLHCGGTTFLEREVRASTGGMVGSFDVLEMVSTLACTRCGYVQWFLKRPTRRQGQAEEHTQPPKSQR